MYTRDRTRRGTRPLIGELWGAERDVLRARYGGKEVPIYFSKFPLCITDGTPRAFQMFVILNTQERTYEQLNSLLNDSGWSVSSVRRKPGDAAFVQIEAKPQKYESDSTSSQARL